MTLKEFLTKYKISTAKFAQRLNMHPNHIWMVANNRRTASLETALKIEELTNGEVTAAEVRANRNIRIKCPCCSRLLPLGTKLTAN